MGTRTCPVESVSTGHVRREWGGNERMGSRQSAAEAAGGAVWLLVPAALIVGAALVGWRVFERAAPRIAEDL